MYRNGTHHHPITSPRSPRWINGSQGDQRLGLNGLRRLVDQHRVDRVAERLQGGPLRRVEAGEMVEMWRCFFLGIMCICVDMYIYIYIIDGIMCICIYIYIYVYVYIYMYMYDV